MGIVQLLFVIFGVLSTGILLLALVWFIRVKGLSIWLVVPLLAAFIPVSYIDRHFMTLNPLVVWSPFFIVVASAFGLLFGSRRLPRISVGIVLFYMTLLMVSITSALVNGRPLLDILYVHRGYFILFSLLVIFGHFRHKIEMKQMHSFIVWAGIVSGVVAIMQRLVIVSLLKMGSGDLISGFFGADGEYLFLQLTCLIITLAYWLHGRDVIGFSNKYVLAFLLFSMAVGNNKAAWAFIFAIFVLISSISGVRIVARNLGSMLLFTLLVIGAYTLFDYVYTANYRAYRTEAGVASYVGDKDFINDYFFGNAATSQFTKGGALKRGAAIVFAYEHLKENPPAIFLGLGPGATAKFTSGSDPGYFQSRFPTYKVGRTSLSCYWAELGLVGVLLLVALTMVISKSNSLALQPGDRIMRRTVALLFIAYLGYDSLLQEISVMIIIATFMTEFQDRQAIRDTIV